MYVVRDNLEELLLKLKWDGDLQYQRMIVVTENINHLKPLAPFLNQLSIRVVTDQDLLTAPFAEMFYQWDGMGWIKDQTLQQQATGCFVRL